MAGPDPKIDTLRSLSPLAERFAAVYAELAAIDSMVEDAFERLKRKIACKACSSAHRSCRSESECLAYLEYIGGLEEQMGINELSAKRDQIYSRLDPIVTEIARIHARDLGDLALKANALASAQSHFWESAPEDLEYIDILCRDLIENICALAGVALAAKELARRRHGSPQTDCKA
ncbi:hypothetical protein I6F35_38325 [Bradyrhizobium sp. BRP22]|uniref:hypothetical protein n=1 Tax=Bradyrhizobium sp. BRP22 TaxID=2793821 RepID=UPI001CD780CE|nr:hypothetical protein [Bradyrhizobium sp. BRP22]MCA1458916.1 hypothetical protein [Bradyrhizobium sp. BRP22]